MPPSSLSSTSAILHALERSSASHQAAADAQAAGWLQAAAPRRSRRVLRESQDGPVWLRPRVCRLRAATGEGMTLFGNDRPAHVPTPGSEPVILSGNTATWGTRRLLIGSRYTNGSVAYLPCPLIPSFRSRIIPRQHA